MKKIVVVVAVVVLALVVIAGTAVAANVGAPAANSVLAAITPTTAQDKAYVGISLANITAQVAQRLSLSQTTGVVITLVAPNSPAATAGLKRADVVTAVNGAAVSTATDVTDQIAKSKPGDVVTFAIKRGTQTMNIQVTTATAPAKANGGFLGRGSLLPPDVKGLLDGVPLAQLFGHNLGSTRTLKDKDGNTVTIYTIPGVVTAISPTSITITPNNSSSRGGPFSIDGTTSLLTGNRTPSTNDIAVNDQVTVTVVGNSNHASQLAKQTAGAGRMGGMGGMGGMRGPGGMDGMGIFGNKNGTGTMPFRGNGGRGGFGTPQVAPPAAGSGA